MQDMRLPCVNGKFRERNFPCPRTCIAAWQAVLYAVRYRRFEAARRVRWSRSLGALQRGMSGLWPSRRGRSAQCACGISLCFAPTDPPLRGLRGTPCRCVSHVRPQARIVLDERPLQWWVRPRFAGGDATATGGLGLGAERCFGCAAPLTACARRGRRSLARPRACSPCRVARGGERTGMMTTPARRLF